MTAERREAIRDHADLSKNAIAARDIRELLDALDAADSSLACSLNIQRAEKQTLISEIEAHAQTKAREAALRAALASIIAVADQHEPWRSDVPRYAEMADLARKALGLDK
jgi:hypothetical protein